MRDLVAVFWMSTKLALRGALVRDLEGTALRAAVATLIGSVVGIAAVLAGGPLWLATLIGGLIAGALAPYLLRNIKIA